MLAVTIQLTRGKAEGVVTVWLSLAKYNINNNFLHKRKLCFLFWISMSTVSAAVKQEVFSWKIKKKQVSNCPFNCTDSYCPSDSKQLNKDGQIAKFWTDTDTLK